MVAIQEYIQAISGKLMLTFSNNFECAPVSQPHPIPPFSGHDENTKYSGDVQGIFGSKVRVCDLFSPKHGTLFSSVSSRRHSWKALPYTICVRILCHCNTSPKSFLSCRGLHKSAQLRPRGVPTRFLIVIGKDSKGHFERSGTL